MDVGNCSVGVVYSSARPGNSSVQAGNSYCLLYLRSYFLSLWSTFQPLRSYWQKLKSYVATSLYIPCVLWSSSVGRVNPSLLMLSHKASILKKCTVINMKFGLHFESISWHMGMYTIRLYTNLCQICHT